MQPVEHAPEALSGAVSIHGLAAKLSGVTTLNGTISGFVELGGECYPWEESEADPESATDADQHLEMNIELLDAIWQKVVITDTHYVLDLATVIDTSAQEISKAIRALIASGRREVTEDLFAHAGQG